MARRALSLLEVLGNETRRKILELLAKEPKYLLQLSRELNVSQQAILKHINVLVKAGLIRAYEVKAGSLGPSRKYYELAKPIFMSVNLFKGYSEVEVYDFLDEIPQRLRETLVSIEKDLENGKRLEELLSEVRETIQVIDRELQEVKARERALLSAKCKLLNLVYESLSRLGVPSSRCKDILEKLLG
ncbi:MAG: helix-turn-helix domain-containing protein [Candidatus Nezhaarchaeales archaeon]